MRATKEKSKWSGVYRGRHFGGLWRNHGTEESAAVRDKRLQLIIRHHYQGIRDKFVPVLDVIPLV